MERRSVVYVAPRNNTLDLQDRANGSTTSTLGEVSFKPLIPNTLVTSSKNERGANVIFATDLAGEIDEVKRIIESEGLQKANLIFNGFSVRVSAEIPTKQIVNQFLNDNGVLNEQYYQLNTARLNLLDNAVFAACAVSKILNEDDKGNIPVRFKFETSFVRYDTATVFKQDTPEDVFDQLKGKLWLNGIKGKIRESRE